MKFSLLFAWYDFWIGFFYDKKKNWLYILPLPMIGLIIKFPVKRYWLVSKYGGDIIGSCAPGDLEYCCKVDPVYGKSYWATNGDIKPLFGKDYNE